jgi:hypothetical protein
MIMMIVRMNHENDDEIMTTLRIKPEHDNEMMMIVRTNHEDDDEMISEDEPRKR